VKEMDGFELRCVIKFLWLGGKSNKDIVDEMYRVYGDGCISLRTVQKWTCRFKNWEISIEDRERSGRPKNTELRVDVKALLMKTPSPQRGRLQIFWDATRIQSSKSSEKISKC